jgi:hypothetical protein
MKLLRPFLSTRYRRPDSQNTAVAAHMAVYATVVVSSGIWHGTGGGRGVGYWW